MFRIFAAALLAAAILCAGLAPSSAAGPVGSVWVSTHGTAGVGSFTVQGAAGTRVAVRALQSDGSYLLQGNGVITDASSITFGVTVAAGQHPPGMYLFQVGFSSMPSGPLNWVAVVPGNGEFDWLWD